METYNALFPKLLSRELPIENLGEKYVIGLPIAKGHP